MIRVILQGRTGNNLFQYAVGRALALRHTTDLVLDGSWMDQSHANTFEHLLRLPIKARYERRLTLSKRLGRKALGLGPEQWHWGSVIKDKEDDITSIQQAVDGSLLIGFFQNYSYFTGIEKELRSELDLSQLHLPEDSLRFEEELGSQVTVSIHVRRGDYLKIPETHCLSENYHQRAIDWFKTRYENIRFCVFSDDINWCRNHFQGSKFIFCDFPLANKDPLHDMRQMSSCDHHIIVNSSYSWWGAWLNPTIHGEVVAPQMWMKNFSSSQIIPSNWTTL